MSTSKSKKAQKKEKLTAISSTLYSRHSTFSMAYVCKETSSAQNPDNKCPRLIIIANNTMYMCICYQLALRKPGKFESYKCDLKVNLPNPDLVCTAQDRPDT